MEQKKKKMKIFRCMKKYVKSNFAEAKRKVGYNTIY